MIGGPFFDNGIARLYQTDVRRIPLPDESVHCVVTSPLKALSLPMLLGESKNNEWR